MNEPTLQEQLVSHPKAIISTDDNYPTIIQIPLDDLTAFIEKAERKVLIEYGEWRNIHHDPKDVDDFLKERKTNGN